MKALVTLIFTTLIQLSFAQSIRTGAESTEEYTQDLQNKKLALVVNQTSTIKNTHLVDSLLSLGFQIDKIFSPEHGFRGDKDAGEHVKNSKDEKTGIELVSLYGNNKKPTPEQLKGIDLVIFDIQDVGARFYTYISTLHYVMEACAENEVDLLVLDRPNPNGWYIDGPILDTNYRSFVGMHPIPIVHGLTIGELALMINEEGWLKNKLHCALKIITCQHYTHQDKYSLPIAPSPNLPNDLAINLYPSLCFFEGTEVSVGRGTEFPFQQIGSPFFPEKKYSFTPISTPGKAKNPMYENKSCFGYKIEKEENKLNLSYLIEFYKKSPNKEKFFTSLSFFHKLAGTNQLYIDIKEGKSEEEIRKSWQKPLSEYQKLREKYLLYPDFN